MGKNIASKGSSKQIGENEVDQKENQIVIPRGSVRQKIAMFENKTIEQNFAEEEQYDLTPVVTSPSFRRKSIPSSPAYTVDPYEFSTKKDDDDMGEEHQLSPTR
jgi:hypothetical protein